MSFSITIIGGKGRMGAMLAGEWSARHAVRAVDRTLDGKVGLALAEGDLAASVPASDIVLLCVPAPAVPKVLDRVLPHMPESGLLADICSVKIHPMRAMEARYEGPVVGTHPFFGPANNRQGARVALVRGQNAHDAHMATLDELFRDLGCATFEVSAEEHDRHVAVSQSLHFALSAAYFATVNREENIEPYLTPSFKRYMNAARKELTVNAAMFCEFTADNPMFPETLAGTRAILEKAEKGGLAAIAEEARAWYDKHGPA